MYKLLVFNEDWADEHDVPALAVMSEENYEKWLETPSGRLNKKYDEDLKAYNQLEERKEEISAAIKKEGCWNKSLKSYPEYLKKLYNEYCDIGYLDSPIRVYSYINAHLGNSGDGFGEGFSSFYLMKEFVEEGIVQVTDVTDEFADTFFEAGLERLSLCNIFEPGNLDYCPYDNEEDEEIEEEN
jgi:hypothetical protein